MIPWEVAPVISGRIKGRHAPIMPIEDSIMGQ